MRKRMMRPISKCTKKLKFMQSLFSYNLSSRRAKTTVTSGSMRKRMMRPISKCTKKLKSNNYKKDWISLLPDEIIVSIVSLLGIREAARTCVLSKRWEHVWTYSYNRVLNFDASETFFALESGQKVVEVERCRYISWVNKVVECFRGSTIDEFRVCFCLNISSSRVIDRWIEFAIAKSVQRLELDLEPCNRSFWDVGEGYAFPNQSYFHIKSPAGLSSISSLKSLCLKDLNISGEILEYFLSNCPLLESLHVERSDHLVNLKVFGSSLRLKFLEISKCPLLNELEVCATSLVSFKYFGPGGTINMQIKDAFQLVEVSSSDFIEPIDHALFRFSSYFSQLETLSLGIVKEGYVFRQLPKFTKLKHLTLQVAAGDFESLLGWTNLIHASPLLNKFKLQLLYFKSSVEVQRRMRKAWKRPHQCLKEVELVGFVGHLIDLELTQYLIKNAVMLEKIIIDRHFTSFSSRRRPWMFEETEEKQYAKERAMELKASLPAGIEMVII
ncbi:putative F-box/LRR-repeat protein At4g15060 [Cornus florida]|uniref:putative F-box/LRR-repeat protein At4g15060 n=1 Tax=Cornus florida TaxID=4283 RepID=UPI0028A136A4|nr:putative F-box/LRR-repeat protein At4g15060 [Cornus florida]